jgi:hypothetical protein
MAVIILSNKFNYGEVFQRAKKNARLREIEFLLTKIEFDALVEKADGRCMVSGLPFSAEAKREFGKRRPFAPSLDRIDSAIGYTKENCRIVSVIVNCALNEWGMEPFLEMCEAVVERQKQIAKMKGYKKLGEAKFCRPSEYLEAVGNSEISPMSLARRAYTFCKRNNLPTKEKFFVGSNGLRTVKATVFPIGVLRECLETNSDNN